MKPLPFPPHVCQELARVHGIHSRQDLRDLEQRLPPARWERVCQSILDMIGNRPDHPQRSFVRFLYDHLWTIDTNRAGEQRAWPTDARWGPDALGRRWDPLWLDWEMALLTCSPLLVDKTRRILASNIVCGFDLWLALGGQDERWPELMLSKENRLILIAARKLEGQTGSQEFVDRIAKEYKLAISRGLRTTWPEVPTMKMRKNVLLFSNGSSIHALPHNADEVRGPGPLLLHCEELATWEEAQNTIETAVGSLSGTGHLVAVTTPAAVTYAADLRSGRLHRA